MNIAVITITRDDRGSRLEQWKSFYNEYKDDLYVHIIVDNASTPEYREMLKKTFPDSVIIQRETNGGCTIAYNDGIKYCLQDGRIDAIALLANDIKLSKGALPILCDRLYSDNTLGMISPIECSPNSDIVSQYGHVITEELTMKCLEAGVPKNKITDSIRYTQMLPGGVNLAKSEFYKNVGLQDELLFMYSDEIDTAIRAETAGYKLAVTTDATCWHMHIAMEQNANRKPACNYLMSRNKMYLAKKHFSKDRQVTVKRYFRKAAIKNLFIGLLKIKKHLIIESIYTLRGIKAGSKGNMSPNKYSVP